MSARRTVALVLGTLLAIAASIADAPSAQQSAAKSSPGRIEGVVVADDTGMPLPHASVRVLGGPSPRVLTSDAEGRFETGDLPAGSYFVTVASNGYVTGASGQRTPADRPSQLSVTAGAIRGVEIRLTPFGTIGGRIVHEDGRPAANVAVFAQQHPATPAACRTFRQENRVSVETCQTTTDVNGEYVLRRIPNGNYHVIAVAPIDTVAPANAGASPSPTGITALLAPLPAGMHAYFPGTAFPEQAATVRVQAATQANASFVLVRSALSRLAGHVVNAGGAPAKNTFLVLNPRTANLRGNLPPMIELDEQGRFEFTNVSPGEYDLAARSTETFVQIAQTGSGGKGIAGERANVRVRVLDNDLDEIRIQTGPGYELSGVVTTGGGSIPRAKQAPFVVATPTTLSTSFDSMNTVRESVDANDRFRLPNVVGPHVISVSGLAPGLMMRRVLIGAVDITDSGIDVLQNLEVQIVVGPQTEVTGRVATRRGEAVPGMSAVLFAQDPQRWTLPGARYVRAAAANVDGTFVLTGLPAGSYYAAATPAPIVMTTQGPANSGRLELENLDLFIPHAVPFELRDGERRTVNVSVN